MSSQVAIQGSFSVKSNLRENLEALTEMADEIEKLIPESWEPPIYASTMSLSDRLRKRIT